MYSFCIVAKRILSLKIGKTLPMKYPAKRVMSKKKVEIGKELGIPFESLLIRRPQVRILPGAPTKLLGYESSTFYQIS